MIGRFLRECSGNMSILFACAFTLCAGMSVLAVDVGSLYHERRQVQAGVDLAAISAASNPSQATQIATDVLEEAGLLPPGSTDGLVVRTGNYDTRRPIAGRFQPGAGPINAVRVTLERRGTLHFGTRLMEAPTISASGIAAVKPDVSFSVGSRLASLNGGIANALLTNLLGTKVDLSVLDYTALASARIDAFAFLDALATQMNITAGSYDDVLATHAPSGAIAKALSTLVVGPARSALQSLFSSGKGNSVPLDRLFSLGELGKLQIGSEGAVSGLSLSAMEVLSAVAALAAGDRQATIALDATLPSGLAKIGLNLAIGEPPQGRGWFAIGPVGTVVRTAQLRLRLRSSLLGGPVLLGAGVNLPIWLDMAFAEARVTSASCPSAAARMGSASVEVMPGIVSLTLGDPSDTALQNFEAQPAAGPVRLIDLLALRVTGSGQVRARQTTPLRLDFSAAEIASGAQKTARTQTLVASLATSLMSELQLDVQILGLGLGLTKSLIEPAVRALIAPLAPTLDMAINATFSTLGLGVGEADVRVYGVRCHRAVLVG